MTTLQGHVSAAERERLETCILEPIRRPGSIQPHGVLLTADPTTWTIVQASMNVGTLLGVTANELIGTPLSELLGETAVVDLTDVLAGARGAANPVRVRVRQDGTRFDAITHRAGGVIVLELEPALPDEEFASVPAIYAAAGRLRSSATREELWKDAANELSELTGFDHVMVYHFHEDGHGQVVAERRSDASMESYLGLHYPASDIPAQARELYLSKLSRSIYSCADIAFPIHPVEVPATGEPLDLSQAELRSVSPEHLQFMRNMGQASTLSFSLIAGQELIGMITCAHRTPRRLPYRMRQSLEVFADQVAAHLHSMSEIARLTRAGELLQVRSRLVEQFSLTGDMMQALLHGTVTVLDLVPAGGAALHMEGATSTLGDVPDVSRMDRLIEYLRAEGSGLPFASEALAIEHPRLSALLPTVAGLLIIPLDNAQGYLAWFRPEINKTTEWLGDQSESNRAHTLSPRDSFSAWSRSVSGEADPWGELENEAMELGHDLDSEMLRSLESDLAQFALHDALTGLPNRRLLMDRLEHALAGRGRGGDVALLFLDIDSFKAINDSLGHDGGDQVLVQVAQRLQSVTRDSDTVARLGGDEFVVLSANADRAMASGIADRILAAMRRPLTVDGHPVTVTSSIGVATAEPADTATDLMRRADSAMYRAKNSGKNQSAD